MRETEQKNNTDGFNQAESLTALNDGSIFGKFKDAKTLLDAYNSLQSEFTRKCQKLSQLQKLLGENGGQNDEPISLNKSQNLSKNSENKQNNANFNENNGKITKTATENLSEDNSKNNAEIQADLGENQKQTKSTVSKSSHFIKSKFSKDGISVSLFDSGRESETETFNLKAEQADDLDDYNSGDDSYKKGVVEMTGQNEPEHLPKSSQLSGGHEMALDSIVAEKLNDQQFMDKYIFSNEVIKEKIISQYLSNLNKGSSVPSIMSGTSRGVMFSPSNGMPKTLKEAGELLSKMLK